MAREKMQRARELIEAKRYDEARRILRTVDHPTAREWLAKIDAKTAQKPAQKPTAERANPLGYLLAALISTILTSLLLVALVIATDPIRGGDGLTIAELLSIPAPDDEVPTPTIAATEAATVVIGVVDVADRANIRAEPNRSADVLATAMSGTRVEVLGVSDDGEWYNVLLSNGVVGWISAPLLDVDLPPTPVAVAVAEDATPEPTATPENACDAELAQPWWDAAQTLLYRADFIAAQARAGTILDYRQQIAALEADRLDLLAIETPNCLAASVRPVVAAVDNLLLRLADVVNGRNANFEGAQNQLRQASGALLDEHPITPITTDCELEYWVAGMEPYITSLFTLIDTRASMTADSLRANVLAAQNIRRTIDRYQAPDCAGPVRGPLAETAASTITLLQNLAGGQPAGNLPATIDASRSAVTDALRQQGLLPLISGP